MEDNFETIHLMLEDLDKASDLVNDVLTRSREENLDISEYGLLAGKAIGHIYMMKSGLYDIYPELTPEYLRPSLAPVNFTPALERLRSEEWAIRKSTILSFKSHMSDDDASKFSQACESGAEFEFAQEWWGRQKKPFIPVIYIYKSLRHEQRYMRYHSAMLLEDIFEVILWDEQKNDISMEAAETWYRSWQDVSG